MEDIKPNPEALTAKIRKAFFQHEKAKEAKII